MIRAAFVLLATPCWRSENTGAGRGPLVIALIWADLVLPIPQTGDRRARHHLRDIAGRIAGQPRPDHRRPSRLRADAHLRPALRATLRCGSVSTQDGEFVRPERCLGHRLTRSLPYSVREAIVFLAGLAGMPMRKFTAALTIGSVPTAFVFAVSALAGPTSRFWPLW